jgi:hypothetical protein
MAALLFAARNNTESSGFTSTLRTVSRRGCALRHNTAVRWQYRDAPLLWLFVPAYGVHLAEEWLANFPDWIARIVGRPLPEPAFFFINGCALVLIVAAIRAAVRDAQNGWMAVAIATIVLTNAAAHVAGTALTRSYSPGVISAIVLYVPLGTLTMIRAIDQVPPHHLTRGVGIGLALHALVFVIAFSAARFRP